MTITLSLIKFFGLLAIFVSIVIGVQLVANTVMTRRMDQHAINRRLRMLQAGMDRQVVASLLKSDGAAPAHIARGSIVDRFYRMVGRAAIKIAPPRLAVIMLVATLVVFVLLLLLAKALGSAVTIGVVMLLATFAVALGLGLPLMIVNRRAQNRAKRMEEQFPTAIDVFTRALRSGHPVASAIGLLASEMEDPIGTEFGIVSDEIAYGSELNESLHALAERWDLEDLRMFAVSLSVQSETGGNLAEILNNLALVIRDRASLYKKVRALSAEGRFSAWMLSIMPVLTFLALFSINPGFFLDVAGDPLFTYGFVGLLGLYAIGVLWIQNMVDLKV